jgi:copper homeostasis protein
MNARVEICAEGVASALAAGLGGAHRVELCENLAVGGVTPGAGAIAIASLFLPIPVHALIRPRGGDFVYSWAEKSTILRDVMEAKRLGASGVVVGLLDRDGRIDRQAIAFLTRYARPLSLTFHKAFDAARDPFEALDDLIELGVDRILTSGHAATAIDGLSTLAELTRRANGRMVVMAGGSIMLEQIPMFLEAGIQEIHLGSAACLGGAVDPGLVRRIVDAAGVADLYHITTRDAWDLALAHGSYRPPSLATEGFIHASTIGQVAGTYHRFFRDQVFADLVMLRIDPERLTAAIDWAESPHSADPFPHIVGALNLDAVVGTSPVMLWPDDESFGPIDGLE